MRRRVMTRYFEDTSVMMTINMMTFFFRIVLGVALLAFALGSNQDQVLIDAASILSLSLSKTATTITLVVLGGLGVLLIVGLFTRLVGILSLTSIALWSCLLGVAWSQGVLLTGNNNPSETLELLTAYLPLMIYNAGFALLGVFLLVVPVYALEFMSLDGKFFSTPIPTKETDE